MNKIKLVLRVRFLKILHESREENWVFTSRAEFKGMARRVESPQSVILLLHGLGQRGKRIYRKLLAYLPHDALIIAPNAPFPLPRQKEGRTDYGHSWYFYDKVEKSYFTSMDLSIQWLKDLLILENPTKLPVSIIGFSQGGYLSPHVGLAIPETKLVLGLSCEFRSHFLTREPPFKMIALHGELDEIVSPSSQRTEIELLKMRNINIDFHLIAETGHDISSEMASLIRTLMETHGN
jgi:predicted esterase